MIKLIKKGREDIIFRWIAREEKHSTETHPRFDLRTHLTYRQKYEIAKQVIAGTRKMKSIKDKQEVRSQQEVLFEVAMDHGIPEEMVKLGFDCFCKAS